MRGVKACAPGRPGVDRPWEPGDSVDLWWAAVDRGMLQLLHVRDDWANLLPEELDGMGAMDVPLECSRYSWFPTAGEWAEEDGGFYYAYSDPMRAAEEVLGVPKDGESLKVAPIDDGVGEAVVWQEDGWREGPLRDALMSVRMARHADDPRAFLPKGLRPGPAAGPAAKRDHGHAIA